MIKVVLIIVAGLYLMTLGTLVYLSYKGSQKL